MKQLTKLAKPLFIISFNTLYIKETGYICYINTVDTKKKGLYLLH